MKIILSRKGFDSGAGGQASPILPDDTLLSLPIPSEDDRDQYSQLRYTDKPYSEIIRELNPESNIVNTCHLDPDIRTHLIERDNDWKALFGQCNAAQTHLENQGVGVGALFLFFGWFRETENIGGSYRYRTPINEKQAIYGYLQIGKIYRSFSDLPKYAHTHPHAKWFEDYDGPDKQPPIANNCVYEASKTLSWDPSKNGWGCLKYDPEKEPSIILTKAGKTRSRWDLPDFFRNETISYHTHESWKDDYFQSAARGQEFVISDITQGIIRDVSVEVENWAKSLITKNYDPNA